MSALELNADSLERLGAGDAVHVAEQAKARAAAIRDLLHEDADNEEGDRAEQLSRLLEHASAPSEELLATLFPVIEYGEERALEVVPRCLLHIGEATAAARQTGVWRRVGGVVVLGRLVWATTAYALHCGRIDAVAESSRAVVRIPYRDNETSSLIALISLRHPDAFGQDAGVALQNYRDWLSNLELVTSGYPLFSIDVDEAFAEADLLLAMLTGSERGGVYSMGCSTNTVQRLARRVRDAKSRPALAALFSTTMGQLNEVVEAAYRSVQTDRRGFDRPPANLLGTLQE